MSETTETSAGEAGGREALSDERLAELKRLANEVCTCGSSDCDEGTQFGLTPSQANELLAEVERLNEVLHANTVIRNAAESTGRVYKSLAGRLREERDQARTERKAAATRAETAERELAGLRAVHKQCKYVGGPVPPGLIEVSPQYEEGEFE